MKPFCSRGWSRFLHGCGVCAALMLMTQGCGAKPDDATPAATPAGAQTTNTTPAGASAPANASDADMRKSFSQKGFDINQVPEKDRERVRAIMQQNSATNGAPPNPSAGSGTAKP